MLQPVQGGRCRSCAEWTVGPSAVAVLLCYSDASKQDGKPSRVVAHSEFSGSVVAQAVHAHLLLRLLGCAWRVTQGPACPCPAPALSEGS